MYFRFRTRPETQASTQKLDSIGAVVNAARRPRPVHQWTESPRRMAPGHRLTQCRPRAYGGMAYQVTEKTETSEM